MKKLPPGKYTIDFSAMEQTVLDALTTKGQNMVARAINEAMEDERVYLLFVKTSTDELQKRRAELKAFSFGFLYTDMDPARYPTEVNTFLDISRELIRRRKSSK